MCLFSFRVIKRPCAVLQLILNVNGCVAIGFVDLLRDSGAFTPEEADEYIKVCVECVVPGPHGNLLMFRFPF